MSDQSKSPGSVRVGIGTDLHRIEVGKRLVLAGVPIDAPFGLAGHSDADVVLHALMDALLGASGLPDIGELFPNTDEAYEDADSRALMRDVVNRVRRSGFVPINIDLVIHAEKPAIVPHKPALRKSLADLLGLPVDCVNLKAKTGEGIGTIGKGEGIACTAVALVERNG